MPGTSCRLPVTRDSSAGTVTTFMLRLKKKHEGAPNSEVSRPDPRRLLASQSVAGAVTAGVIATLALCGLWVALTVATGRVFPWFTVIQGALIGILVRRYGHGFDYRFPVIAAALACAGAFLGNLVIALPETTRQLDAGVFQVIRGLTWRSFDLFFDEVITAVDYIYGLFGAALAAFYARRRLDRHEEYVLRAMREGRIHE
jgi:hypothetical protein